MTVPGSNLFFAAIALIQPTVIKYLKFSGRTQNEVRQWVSSFETPVDLTASVQKVSRNKYKEFGLDLQKRYIKIFAAKDVIDLQRDEAGDRFIYNGRLYEVNGENDWYEQDGWMSCIAAEIGPAP